MSEPLLSIVIATRNRYEYCTTAIDLILQLLSINAELVLQDNSDDNRLSQVVASKHDDRILYSYQPKPLSFVENFNQAVSSCNGRYVCLLGDDDTITVDINNIVGWMAENEIESVTPKSNIDYIWPNEAILKYNTGQLNMPKFSGYYYQLDVEAELKKLLAAGIIGYQKFGLPRIYHGIVSREALLRVKATTGHFFGGLTPDIYATISLSCVVKKHFILDFPFTIAGACPQSASVISQTGGHSGELSIAPHFNHRGNYIWNKNIPSYYSVETIWAETSLKALIEMNRPELYTLFAKYKFIYQSILSNRKYILKLSLRKSFLQYRSGIVSEIVHIVAMVAYLPFFTAVKVVDIIKNRFVYTQEDKPFIKHSVVSLAEAVRQTQERLKQKKLSFKP